MEHRLRHALDDEQFVLHYQPKLSLRTGQDRRRGGVAALAGSRKTGWLPPGTFLPLLESAGLMAAIGAWALRQAAADCREWRRRRSAAHAGRRQHLPAGTAAAQYCARDPRLHRRSGRRCGLGHRHRDHRGRALRGLVLLRPCPEVAARRGRSYRDRRFRYRILLARTSVGAADRYAEDRSRVHQSAAAGPPELHAGLDHHRSGARVRDDDRRRGCREPRQQLEYLRRAGCDESQGFLHSKPVPRAQLEAQLGHSGETAANPV